MASNTQFPKETYRIDPYKNFRFKLKWEGKYVAGVSKVSALNPTTDVVTYRSGRDSLESRSLPGKNTYEAITLERGVTYDMNFEQWANMFWDYHNTTTDDQAGDSGNKDVSMNDFRKDMILEMYNEAGQKVMAYNIYRCWPSEFTAMPELGENGNTVLIQSMKLQNEGWERVISVQKPTEPNSDSA